MHLGAVGLCAGTSTVTEYLQFHAHLRMPTGATAEAREVRVQALLTDFGLLRCAHSRIGDSMLRGLSGGEKRRLSIATELLTAPRLLLADEPTTGAPCMRACIASLSHLGLSHSTDCVGIARGALSARHTAGLGAGRRLPAPKARLFCGQSCMCTVTAQTPRQRFPGTRLRGTHRAARAPVNDPVRSRANAAVFLRLASPVPWPRSRSHPGAPVCHISCLR